MGDPQPSGSKSTIIQVGPLHSLHNAAELGNLEQIDRVLAGHAMEERNLLLCSKDSNEELPFHCAARGGHLDALELLLPKDLQHLTNAQSSEGLSALHFAAAYGHTKIAKWLFEARTADLNLQDQAGNTPLHLAVPLEHKDVVQYLVKAGANTSIQNNDGMMPVSFCKDPSMFEALFSTLSAVGSSSFDRVRLPLDDVKRTILHYAAQFATDANAIARLIAEADPNQLYEKDYQGDSFLDVAAKSGNMQVLQALKKLGPTRVDLTRLLSDGRRDPLHSPGMYALLHNNREFFDKLITMGKVEITLRCIIKGLIAELIDNPKIQQRLPRLPLFASTLPTYLALYANKECIFDFLLESDFLSLSQWDDEHKRTCLHWAVVDERTDIVEKLCRNAQTMPVIQDGDGKTALQHAFEQKNHMMMEILRAKRGFKDHEENLYRDREVYVQALNAILVGAALVASVTFAGWLQVPSNAEFSTLGLKIFWASNSTSFYTAVAAMCVTITALVPTPRKYVGDIVKQLQVAIVMDAGLLALSLAAVMFAFAAAGFAALRHAHIFTYQVIMRSTTAAGGFLCLIMWLAFVVQLYRCVPPKSVLFALLLPSLPRGLTRWWPASLQKVRARIGDSSRFGYPSKLRSQLDDNMDTDLVAYHAKQLARSTEAPSASNLIPLKNMKRLLCKLDIPDKDSFIQDTYKQKGKLAAHKRRVEGVTSDIIGRFSIPNPADNHM